MNVADFISEYGELVNGTVVLQIRTQVFLVKGFGHLANEQFDGIWFFVWSRRLDGSRDGVSERFD